VRLDIFISIDMLSIVTGLIPLALNIFATSSNMVSFSIIKCPLKDAAKLENFCGAETFCEVKVLLMAKARFSLRGFYV
jgi:hypothetical protein